MKSSALFNKTQQDGIDTAITAPDEVADIGGNGALIDADENGSDDDDESTNGKASNKLFLVGLPLALLSLAVIVLTQLGDQNIAGVSPHNLNLKRGQPTLIKGVPDAGAVTRHLLQRELFGTMVKVKDDREEDDGEEDDLGRYYLGLVSRADVDLALKRNQDTGEEVDVEVEIKGKTYFNRLDVKNIRKRIHKVKRGGGLKYPGRSAELAKKEAEDLLKDIKDLQKQTKQDLLKDFGNIRRLGEGYTDQFTDIKVEQFGDQLFQLECNDVECEVYSDGPLQTNNRRRLSATWIWDEQCDSDSDCPADSTCYEPSYTSGVSSSYYNKCTCSEKIYKVHAWILCSIL
eukprot:Sro28_g018790.1 n/a (345) ;mRNA; f:119287-120389